jgi:hypothetical protein
VKQSEDRTGKPEAVKVARPVWSGGKAEKPNLSLQETMRSPTYPVGRNYRTETFLLGTRVWVNGLSISRRGAFPFSGSV